MFEFTTTTWFILIATFLIVEACTTNFFTIWFACGALVALLSSLVVPDPLVQTTVFVLASAILVVATFPFIKKMRAKKKMIPLNADRNLGRSAVVIAPISTNEQGRVRLDGVDWTAISPHSLAIGEQCRVIDIHSTVLTVEAMPQTASTS